MANARPLRRTATPTASVGRPRPLRFAALFLVVVGALAYANSLSGPLIFDDSRTIVDNASIRQLSTAFRPTPQTPVAGRPVANLSFAINYAIGEQAVAGYHVVNVAIHILAALALFGILRRLFGPSASGGSPLPGTDRATGDGLALICAAAWLLHPLNTETVDYLTQRTESLVGLFLLATIYASIRAWSASPAWPWTVAAIAANLCGAATKESMVITPFLVLLCDRVFAFPTWRALLAARYRLYAGLAVGWLVFLALAGSTPYFAPAGFATHVSRWTYLLNQAPIIARYLRLSVWPRGLVLDYGVPQALTLMDVWPSALFLVALAAAAVVALIRMPRVGFWGAWFFVTLAPASSVIAIPTEVGAERRMYLPLVAVVVVLASAASRLAVVRRYATVIALLVLAALGIATVARNADYRDGVTIWETVLAYRPHARAHANLAVELREAGRVDESIQHLRIAAPEDANSKHALGSALIERGQVAEGLTHLEEFIRLYPRDPHVTDAREELASTLYRAGRLADAIAQQRAVAAALPDYVLGHLNLANLLLESGDYPAAAGQYREVLRLRPANLTAQTQLGIALAAAGALDEAIAAFRKSLAIDPVYATAVRGLVDTLIRQGQAASAATEARRLVTARPTDGSAHSLLGIALAAGNQAAEAEREFEAAIRLNPGLQEARDNLAGLHAGRPRR